MTREQEITQKLERVRRFMASNHYDAVLFATDQNFAWLGCGAADLVDHSNEMGRAFANLIVTEDAHYLVASNIETPRLLAEEVDGLGFEAVEYPWTQGSADPTIASLVREGGRIASDVDFPGGVNEAARLGPLRTPLNEAELDRFRSLCAASARAMDAAVSAVQPGMSELEIQAVVGHAVLREGAFPTLILVGTDDRIPRFRHPIPTEAVLDRYCMIVICAQRWGLVSSLTRLVHFGPFPEELQRRYDALLAVDHTLISATREGRRLSEVFAIGRKAYADAGYPGEEEKHFQGGTCGYFGREQELAPSVSYKVQDGEVFAHNPTITGVKLEDTVLTRQGEYEVLTEIAGWPVRAVTMNGLTLRRPEVLIR